MTMKARKVDIFEKQLTMADGINWEGGKYFRRRIFFSSQSGENISFRFLENSEENIKI